MKRLLRGVKEHCGIPTMPAVTSPIPGTSSKRISAKWIPELNILPWKICYTLCKVSLLGHSKKDQTRKICPSLSSSGKRLRELASWANLAKWLQNPESPGGVQGIPARIHSQTTQPHKCISQLFPWDPERLRCKWQMAGIVQRHLLNII